MVGKTGSIKKKLEDNDVEIIDVVKKKGIDKVLSLGKSIIASIVLCKRLPEIDVQPKIFHSSFINHLNNAPDDFSLDLYLLYLARVNKMNIIDFPVYFNKRLHGEAKGGAGTSLSTKSNLIKRTLRYIIKLKVDKAKGRHRS